ILLIETRQKSRPGCASRRLLPDGFKEYVYEPFEGLTPISWILHRSCGFVVTPVSPATTFAESDPRRGPIQNFQRRRRAESQQQTWAAVRQPHGREARPWSVQRRGGRHERPPGNGVPSPDLYAGPISPRGQQPADAASSVVAMLG